MVVGPGVEADSEALSVEEVGAGTAGVDADDELDLTFEFFRETGLGAKRLRILDESLRVTILVSFDDLSDRPFVAGGDTVAVDGEVDIMEE